MIVWTIGDIIGLCVVAIMLVFCVIGAIFVVVGIIVDKIVKFFKESEAK